MKREINSRFKVRDQARELLDYSNYSYMNMITIYSDSVLAPRPFGVSQLKAILIEPFLIVGVSLFWIVTLPFAAVSLLGVKIWDTIYAFSRNTSCAHPLILRRGNMGERDTAPARGTSVKRA